MITNKLETLLRELNKTKESEKYFETSVINMTLYNSVCLSISVIDSVLKDIKRDEGYLWGK